MRITGSKPFHQPQYEARPYCCEQACLILVEKRETRYRVQWYYRLFEETQRGLTRFSGVVEVVHGSLLALGELLRHTGVLMSDSDKFTAICQYKEASLCFNSRQEKVLGHSFRKFKEDLASILRFIHMLR